MGKEKVKIDGEKLNECLNNSLEIYTLCKNIKKRIGASYGFKKCFDDIEQIYQNIKEFNEDYESECEKVKASLSNMPFLDSDTTRSLQITSDENNGVMNYNDLDQNNTSFNQENDLSLPSSGGGGSIGVNEKKSSAIGETKTNENGVLNNDGISYTSSEGGNNANGSSTKTLGDTSLEDTIMDDEQSSPLAAMPLGDINNNEKETFIYETGLNIDISSGKISFNGKEIDDWSDLVELIEEYGDPLLKSHIYQKNGDYESFGEILENFAEINSYSLTKALCDSEVFAFNVFNEEKLKEMLGSDITFFQSGTTEEQYDVLNQFSLAMNQPDIKTLETLALAYLMLEHPNIANRITYSQENVKSDYTVRTDYHLELDNQYISSQSDLELLEAYYARDIYGQLIKETSFEFYLCSKEEIEDENNYEMTDFSLRFQGEKIKISYSHSNEEFKFFCDGKLMDIEEDDDLYAISEWLKLDKTSLTKEEFDEQMEFLKDNKYCLYLTDGALLERAVVVDITDNAKMQQKYGFYYETSQTTDENLKYNLFSSLKMLETGYCVNTETGESVTNHDVDRIIELLGYKEYEEAFLALDKIKFVSMGKLYDKTASDYLSERGFTAKKVEKCKMSLFFQVKHKNLY